MAMSHMWTIALLFGIVASIAGASPDQPSKYHSAASEATGGATIKMFPKTSDLKPIAVDENFEFKCVCAGDENTGSYLIDILSTTRKIS